MELLALNMELLGCSRQFLGGTEPVPSLLLERELLQQPIS